MQKNDGKKWKNNSVPNTCNILPLKKFFFQNRCIFQVTLKYIKLVIPKILFILVLYNFNFFLKTPPPPKQNSPPPPHPPADKIKKWKFLTLQQRLFYIVPSKCSLQLSYVVKKAKLAKCQNNISSPFLQLTMKPLYVIIMSRRLEWVCPIGGAHLTVPKDCKPFFVPNSKVAWRQPC